MDEKGFSDQLKREAKPIMADDGLADAEKIIVAVHAGCGIGFRKCIEMQLKQVWKQGCDVGYATAVMDGKEDERRRTW